MTELKEKQYKSECSGSQILQCCKFIRAAGKTISKKQKYMKLFLYIKNNFYCIFQKIIIKGIVA